MIDLHMHSTYSDGSLTPAELLDLAEAKGLKILSVTDHSNVRAYQELEDPAVRKRFSGRLLRGCEFSTRVRNQNVEVLGYGIDLAPVQAFFAERKKKFPDVMLAELALIYAAYKERGVRLDWPQEEFSREKHISAKRYVLAQLRAFEENKRFCLDPKNLSEPVRYYRRELYNPKSPLYVDYSPLSTAPEEIIGLIHRAGGKAFLAHCYQYTPDITDHLEEIVGEMKLDGIECYYSTFTPAQTAELLALCDRNHLLVSGGSDFHGALRPEVEMGCIAADPHRMEWIENFEKV